MTLVFPGPKAHEVEFFGGPMDGRLGQTNRDIWYVPRPGGHRVAVYVRYGRQMIYEGDEVVDHE